MKCSPANGGEFSYAIPFCWSLVVGLVLLLAACGTQQVASPPNSSLSDGEPVSVALAQALTLGMKVSAGGVSLQEAKDLKLVNETVYDLSEKPLHHLVLVGPETRDFWATITSPKEGHALYAIGATDKRSFFSFIMPAGSFKSLSQTRAKAGSFARFLSPAAGILYLEDRAGRVWDVATATEVAPEQLEQGRQAQRVLIEQRQKDGILDKVKEDWDRLRAEASKKGLAQSGGLPTLDEVTLPNGSLDVRKLVEALEAQKAARGVSANYTNERAWCMGWFLGGHGLRQRGAERPQQQPHQPALELQPRQPRGHQRLSEWQPMPHRERHAQCRCAG